MSLDMPLSMLALVVLTVFAFAKCQAYLLAGFANVKVYGIAKQPGNLGPWAILRRYNYLWFLPLVAQPIFVVDGKAYPSMSPQAILIWVSFVSTFIGASCVLRDVLERRFGPSSKRERGALIYAAIIAGGTVLLFLISGSL